MESSLFILNLSRKRRMHADLHILLVTLKQLFSAIGSANDAEDHGYPSDASRIRNESCEAIHTLMLEHEELNNLFPTLQWELDSNHILCFGWTDLLGEVEKLLIKHNDLEFH